VGILDKTFFLRNDNLPCISDLALVGMIDLPAFKPDMCSRRFYSTQKLHTDIVAWDDVQEERINGGMDMVEKELVDGEYTFVESRTMSVSLSGHRKYARTLFIRLTIDDARARALSGQLEAIQISVLGQQTLSLFCHRWKSVFVKTDHVQRQAYVADVITRRPDILRATDTRQSDVRQEIVQFIEWPAIPFIASDELFAMLDDGHLYFRTIGPAYKNGNKFMKMKPESGASVLKTTSAQTPLSTIGME
jgi:hypothetical protein